MTFENILLKVQYDGYAISTLERVIKEIVQNIETVKMMIAENIEEDNIEFEVSRDAIVAISIGHNQKIRIYCSPACCESKDLKQVLKWLETSLEYVKKRLQESEA